MLVIAAVAIAGKWNGRHRRPSRVRNSCLAVWESVTAHAGDRRLGVNMGRGQRRRSPISGPSTLLYNTIGMPMGAHGGAAVGAVTPSPRFERMIVVFGALRACGTYTRSEPVR